MLFLSYGKQTPTGGASAVARAGDPVAAVEDVLHGQIYVRPLRLARDLDAIREA
jgi:hypothetical protein